MAIYHGQITHGLLQVLICYSHRITPLSYEPLVVALILATFSMKCLAQSSAENGLAFAAAGGDINALTFDQIIHHTCGNLHMAVFWSTEECDRLIEEIRKYELWKSDHKDYGKHGQRLVAWKKIASTLDRGYSSLCTNRINHSRR